MGKLILLLLAGTTLRRYPNALTLSLGRMASIQTGRRLLGHDWTFASGTMSYGWRSLQDKLQKKSPEIFHDTDKYPREFTGKASIISADGHKFEGYLDDGWRVWGTYTWPSGKIFVGQFHEDEPVCGTMTWSGGSRLLKFVGDWSSMSGLLYYSDGRTFALVNGESTLLSEALENAQELVPADDAAVNAPDNISPLVRRVFNDEDVTLLDCFECPITKQIMRDPVILLADGHTYERAALKQWFETGHLTSPLTGNVVKSNVTTVKSNVTLRKGIIEFLEKLEKHPELKAAFKAAQDKDRQKARTISESGSTKPSKRRRLEMTRQETHFGFWLLACAIITCVPFLALLCCYLFVKRQKAPPSEEAEAGPELC